MKRTSYLLVVLMFVGSSFCVAQDTKPKRSDYVSDVSFTVASHRPAKSDHSPESMAKAGNAFLKSLGEELGAKARHKIDSGERRQWTNLPARRGAGGVRFGEMNSKQAKAACDLLASILSEYGYQKMVDIMIADDQLLSGGRRRQGFGTEDFAIVVFGKPSASDPWAVQLDGHHIGLNVAIQGKKLTISPSFIGTQPHKYSVAKKSVVPFQGETNDAYALVQSLDKKQLASAQISKRRVRIRTGPGNDGRIPRAVGIEVKQFNEKQKKALTKLISNWVKHLPKSHAEQRMKQIMSEYDKMRFAWGGGTQKGSDISYYIQSPSLIIEYACQDLGRDPKDHLHSMYRNPKNEYGGQLKK